MSTPLAQTVWAACRSSLELHRWTLGELGASESAEVASHVDSCARCKPVVERLKAEQAEPLPPLRALNSPSLKLVDNAQAFPKVQSRPEARLRAPKSPGGEAARSKVRIPRFAAIAATGLAAAAALFLVFKPVPAERIKGSGTREFSLGMYVQHGADVRRASPGEQVQAGDALRFSITSESSAYAAVLSLDPAGRASIYFPLDARAAKVPAGADVPLPLSTRLDGTVGEEHLFGLLCASPVELGPVRESLEHGALQVPSDCQVARWSFVKH